MAELQIIKEAAKKTTEQTLKSALVAIAETLENGSSGGGTTEEEEESEGEYTAGSNTMSITNANYSSGTVTLSGGSYSAGTIEL